MKTFLMALATTLTLVAVEAFAQSPSESSIQPNVDVKPLPNGNGVLVNPSVSTSIPLGDGVNLNAGASLPIIVPSAGNPQVLPPTISLGFRIPL